MDAPIGPVSDRPHGGPSPDEYRRHWISSVAVDLHCTSNPNSTESF